MATDGLLFHEGLYPVPTAKQLNDAAAPVWERYFKTRSIEDRNALAEIYFPLVKAAAARLKLPISSSVDFDDHVSNGSIGLMQAIETYNDAKGTAFTTFARLRIRGAIIDGVRKVDWVPRLERTHQKAGRVDPPQMGHFHQYESGNRTTDTADHVVDDCCGEPSSQIECDDWWLQITSGLEETDRQLVLMYFRRNITMRECGRYLGFSESRVSQRVTRLLHFIRKRLRGRRDEVVLLARKWSHRMDKRMNESNAMSDESFHDPDYVRTKIAYHEQELESWKSLLKKLTRRKKASSKSPKER